MYTTTDENVGSREDPVRIPPGYRLVRDVEYDRMQACSTFVNDLSRSQHGRHKGDAESQTPGGTSLGNPALQPGQIVGYNLSGTPYIYPDVERADLRNMELWGPGHV